MKHSGIIPAYLCLAISVFQNLIPGIEVIEGTCVSLFNRLMKVSYHGMPQFLRFYFPFPGNVLTILDCQNSDLKSLIFVTNHTKSTSVGNSLLEAYREKILMVSDLHLISYYKILSVLHKYNFYQDH